VSNRSQNLGFPSSSCDRPSSGMW